MARPARAAKPTDLTEKDAAPLGSDDDAASSNGKGDDDDDDASVVESAAAAPAKAEAPKKPRARKPASKLKKKAPIGGQGTAGAGAAPMTATLRAAVAAPAPLAGWKAAPLGPGAALDADPLWPHERARLVCHLRRRLPLLRLRLRRVAHDGRALLSV